MLAEVGVKPNQADAIKITSFLEKTLADGGGILGCCKSLSPGKPFFRILICI